MNYLKGLLSGLTAFLLAEFVLAYWSLFRGIGENKATGMGVVYAGLMESGLSPLFWTLAISIFLVLFAASRVGNKVLRVSLFWIPTVTISALGMGFVALCTFVVVHFRDH
jgi:hypothetical protein